MKKISLKNISYIPASHEDKDDPGVLKKALFEKNDFPLGSKIEMINWATLLKGKSFKSHYHEDMDEVFIIISGKLKIEIDGEKDFLEKGDAVFIPMKKIHQMENIDKEDAHYIVVGVSLGKNGKTVRVV